MIMQIIKILVLTLDFAGLAQVLLLLRSTTKGKWRYSSLSESLPAYALALAGELETWGRVSQDSHRIVAVQAASQKLHVGEVKTT